MSEPSVAPTVALTELTETDFRCIEGLCTQFEAACQAGTSPSVEDYCAEVSESLRPALQAELLALEEAYRQGGPVPAFAGYENVRKVGKGGMGIVYRAWNTNLERYEALKVPTGSLSARDLARFRFEAATAAGLAHPNIVRVHGVGEANGLPYMAMEWIEGRTLSAALPEIRRDLHAAAALLAKVARAVHHAHEEGEILHRDLKPGNILLDEAGPHVTDFGLARRLDKQDSLSLGGIAGTPAYMAPEQARGEPWLTAATDVYGLGAILYEILTGRPPFVGENAIAVLQQVAEGKSPPRPSTLVPGIDENLEVVCLKCLAREPADRYTSAEALAEDLERCRDGKDPRARPPGFWDWLRQLWRTRPARGLYASAGAPAALVRMGLGVLAVDIAILAILWLGLSAGWAWGVLAARVVLQWGVYRRLLGRFQELEALERHSIIIGLSLLAFQVALWFMYVPVVPWASAAGAVHIFAPLQAAFGMTLVINGSTSWGRLMPVGLVLILLSPLLAWLPEWSPLLHGAMVVPVLFWWAYCTKHYFVEESARA
jgi:serine/threonine-protein kinase